jgi:hypothetical protein
MAVGDLSRDRQVASSTGSVGSTVGGVRRDARVGETVAEPPVNVTASTPEFAGNPRASQEHALVTLIVAGTVSFCCIYQLALLTLESCVQRASSSRYPIRPP